MRCAWGAQRVLHEMDQFALAFALAGHDNWVRSLSFATFDADATYLASASQDKFIRVWKMTWTLQDMNATPETTPAVGPTVYATRPIKKHVSLPGPQGGSLVLQAKLASLLIGHDDWVYHTMWCPKRIASGKGCVCPWGSCVIRTSHVGDGNMYHADRMLLSTSSDGMVMLWSFDPAMEVWQNKVTAPEASMPARRQGALLGVPGGCCRHLWILWCRHQ